MKALQFMLIAGEASGDLLAAELVTALRQALRRRHDLPTADLQPLRTELAPQFFGAGGPHMAAAGVGLALDLTTHAVTGLIEVVRQYRKFRRIFNDLLQLACQRQPDAIVLVDFSGFNRRFAAAVKRQVCARQGIFGNWNPKLIQYVSPQVWASRPGRARSLERDVDLLLSIIPFEQAWYAQHAPALRVEFVGHPIVDRHPPSELRRGLPPTEAAATEGHTRNAAPRPLHVLLLPGSRAGELRRHLPVMIGALEQVKSARPAVGASMILPNTTLLELAKSLPLPPFLDVQVGDLTEALNRATVALASTGTVTLECACHGVPFVAVYQTAWATYQVAKRVAKVKYLAMPNLLADEEVIPEFIQHAATPHNIAQATLALLDDESRRRQIQRRLIETVSTLGPPGASQRAAAAILRLF